MKASFALAVCLLITFQSHGWGSTGHRVTGWVAEQHLKKKTLKKVRALLGNESLAIASIWMDEVRSDSTYDHMTDWHWVTIENGQTYDQSGKNENGDVILTLERIIADLKSRKLDRKKEIEALKILVHLVGDIHQPLHVGCCGDQGGNRVQVKWFRDNSNLHRVWDSDMIDGTRLSYTELAQSLGTPDKATIQKWQTASVRDWADESMSVRSQIYDIGKGNLGYEYSYKHLPLAEQRMLQAGVRLAGILNQIYGM